MAQKENTGISNSPETGFTDEFLSHAYTPVNVGMFSDADGYGAPTGVCGDTIEIWIKVSDAGTIEKARFMTDGCAHTVACSSVITGMAEGMNTGAAAAIRADDIVDALGGLPEDHVHCARLAVTTMKLAVKDYLKKRRKQ